MVVIFLDGFDKYGPPTTTGGTTASAQNITALTSGEWTSANAAGSGGSPFIVSPLSSTGYALNLRSDGAGSGTRILKTLSANYTRLIGGVRVSSDLSANTGLGFRDAGTYQCVITINTTGLISLRTGNFSTAIATSSTSVSANSIHYLEWDITFGTSANYQLWLDGVSLFSGSTGNTRGGTTNAYANQIIIGDVNGQNITYDDLYLFDPNTGSANIAVLNTNPRIETQFPTGDHQTQFTGVGAILGVDYTVDFTTNGPGAVLFLRKYTADVNMTLNSVSCIPATTSASCKSKAMYYADSAGAPNGSPTVGTEVVGSTSGITLTGTFSSPPSLTAGTPYWIGFIMDTSLNFRLTDNSTSNGYSLTNTYPTTPSSPAVVGSKSSWIIWGNCTGATTNWETQKQNPPVGDPSSIISSTVNNEDLYSFPVLTTTPNNIYAVAVKGYVKKSDTGARTIDLRTKSVATDSAGSNAGQTPATSYAWMGSFFETDPATGLAWGGTALNAAWSGPKVAS